MLQRSVPLVALRLPFCCCALDVTAPFFAHAEAVRALELSEGVVVSFDAIRCFRCYTSIMYATKKCVYVVRSVCLVPVAAAWRVRSWE